MDAKSNNIFLKRGESVETVAQYCDGDDHDETKTNDANKSRRLSRRGAPPRRRLSSSLSSSLPPFHGVVACLTGMSATTKDRYHQWIIELGGKYTRDFDPRRNTHLIAQEPSGEKYQSAMDHLVAAENRSSPNNPSASSLSSVHDVLMVVKPSWLEGCHRNQTRLVEDPHSWPITSNINKQRKKKRSSTSLAAATSKLSLLSCLDRALLAETTKKNDEASPLPPKSIITTTPAMFANCHFFLIGFDHYNVDVDGDDENNNNNSNNENNLNQPKQKQQQLQQQEERNKLSRLIRRGMGTIHWEFEQDLITHIVVHDDQCNNQSLRESLSKAKTELLGGGSSNMVSPWWIVDSWNKQELLPTKDYPPEVLLVKSTASSGEGAAGGSKPNKKLKKEQQQQQQQQYDTVNSRSGDGSNSRSSSHLLFRGMIFVLLRISNPSPHIVDYDTKELENLIRKHGGQILSLKLLETLKLERQATLSSSSSNINKTQKQQERGGGRRGQMRNLHVVCFGGGLKKQQQQQQGAAQQQHQQFALHPLLAQIQRRDICEIIKVTPNWLRTCVVEQTLIDPADAPILFQPQTWAWQKFLPPPGGTVEQQTEEGKPNMKGISSSSKGGNDTKENNSNSNSDTIVNVKKSQQQYRISITGFQGPKRTAIVQTILAMGATYYDDLRQGRTTHLICCCESHTNNKKGFNPKKSKKAREWGIPVVSEQWLYHLLRYGGGGGGSSTAATRRMRQPKIRKK